MDIPYELRLVMLVIGIILFIRFCNAVNKWEDRWKIRKSLELEKYEKEQRRKMLNEELAELEKLERRGRQNLGSNSSGSPDFNDEDPLYNPGDYNSGWDNDLPEYWEEPSPARTQKKPLKPPPKLLKARRHDWH